MTTNKRAWRKTAVSGICVLLAVIFLFLVFCPSAGAVGLVDDTVDTGHEYSRYPLENYQLDFYVDNGWEWLPWNWTDGIGKQVMYGLYCITNFVWTINLYLSNASGYLVQEAYSLDFISETAGEIGQSIQTIAGISPSGLSSDGFYAGFLMLIILIVGAYVAYVGLIKRETTKAVRAVMNTVLIFVLSGALIAYAPDCVRRLNEFSKDISTASLTVGTRIVMPGESGSGDSVDLIRDSLFAVQVKQPWLLLQFGDTDIDAERTESLLSASPSENNGEDRENAVKAEIEDNENTNLTVTKAVSRLGTVFFLFLFNIGISIFVFLLTGMMILSQVLFIIYAMFMPMSFVISLIPSFEGSSKRAVIKLFNTIFARAGITLIITIAFSISTMLYRISDSYPFFVIAFLQVTVFAGIFFKMGDLLNMFALHDDGRGIGRQMMRRPRMLMHRQLHRLNRTMRASRKRGNNSSAKERSDKASGSKGKEQGDKRPAAQNAAAERRNSRASSASAQGGNKAEGDYHAENITTAYSNNQAEYQRENSSAVHVVGTVRTEPASQDARIRQTATDQNAMQEKPVDGYARPAVAVSRQHKEPQESRSERQVRNAHSRPATAPLPARDRQASKTPHEMHQTAGKSPVPQVQERPVSVGNKPAQAQEHRNRNGSDAYRERPAAHQETSTTRENAAKSITQTEHHRTDTAHRPTVQPMERAKTAVSVQDTVSKPLPVVSKQDKPAANRTAVHSVQQTQEKAMPTQGRDHGMKSKGGRK